MQVLATIGVAGVLTLTLRVSDNITRHIKAQQQHHKNSDVMKHVNAVAAGHTPASAQEENRRREVLMAAVVMQVRNAPPPCRSWRMRLFRL